MKKYFTFLVLVTLFVSSSVQGQGQDQDEDEDLDHSLDQDPNTVCGLQDYAKFKYLQE
jgi:hypothetical protein